VDISKTDSRRIKPNSWKL